MRAGDFSEVAAKFPNFRLFDPASGAAGSRTQFPGSVIPGNRISPIWQKALQFYPLLQSQCLSRLGQPDELGGIPPSNLERSGADTSALNPVLAAMNPAVRTAAPILIPQGEADTTVFPVFTSQLKDQLIGLGDNVTYKTYPGVNHGGVVTAGEPDALAFFEQMLPPRH